MKGNRERTVVEVEEMIGLNERVDRVRLGVGMCELADDACYRKGEGQRNVRRRGKRPKV